MNELAKKTITSLEISEISGKRHNAVLKAIRSMEAAWANVTGGNFALSDYTDPSGRKLPMYELSKTECLYIASKFNDEARAKLVMRWESLEIEKARVLTATEVLLETIKQMVEHEREIENLKERQSQVEDKVNNLLDLQEINRAELKALPLSTEVVSEMRLRDKVRLLTAEGMSL